MTVKVFFDSFINWRVRTHSAHGKPGRLAPQNVGLWINTSVSRQVEYFVIIRKVECY